ncbi:ArsR/SmtB family transcription factor [Kutzneria sp. NPDC052558]|uniref:ArsR/SmtB family transcription factor n=1 Tax=Kutzneria sp. NPDC052558 TaxID=3364121 RepID=UPI0037C6A5F2
MSDYDERLADLERRVAALEGVAAAPEGLEAGIVGYQGDVRLNGDLSWQIRFGVDATLTLPDGPRVDLLAALGHPVRAAIVRHLIAHGAQPAPALSEAAGLRSTGQLYHHLKALVTAKAVEQDSRGSYRVPPTAVIPLLVILTAAADVAGQLR